jgi:hypothetical protein
VQQQVQQPERLLPIARNRYSPHQQLKSVRSSGHRAD